MSDWNRSFPWMTNESTEHDLDNRHAIEEAMFTLMVASAERGRTLADSEATASDRWMALRTESVAFRNLYRLVIR